MVAQSIPELEVWFYIISIATLIGSAAFGFYKLAVKAGENREVQKRQLETLQELVATQKGMRADFQTHLESDDERFRTITERVMRLEPPRRV